MTMQTDKLLPFNQVKALTGLSRTTIWRYEQAGNFPLHVVLSSRCVRWKESEVLAWMQNLGAKS